jgi:hypothetical protein
VKLLLDQGLPRSAVAGLTALGCLELAALIRRVVDACRSDL